MIGLRGLGFERCGRFIAWRRVVASTDIFLAVGLSWDGHIVSWKETEEEFLFLCEKFQTARNYWHDDLELWRTIDGIDIYQMRTEKTVEKDEDFRIEEKEGYDVFKNPPDDFIDRIEATKYTFIAVVNDEPRIKKGYRVGEKTICLNLPSKFVRNTRRRDIEFHVWKGGMKIEGRFGHFTFYEGKNRNNLEANINASERSPTGLSPRGEKECIQRALATRLERSREILRSRQKQKADVILEIEKTDSKNDFDSLAESFLAAKNLPFVKSLSLSSNPHSIVVTFPETVCTVRDGDEEIARQILISSAEITIQYGVDSLRDTGLSFVTEGAYPHPHTSGANVPLSRRSMCLGNIDTQFREATKKIQIYEMVQMLWEWFRSANANDHWGNQALDINRYKEIGDLTE